MGSDSDGQSAGRTSIPQWFDPLWVELEPHLIRIARAILDPAHLSDLYLENVVQETALLLFVKLYQRHGMPSLGSNEIKRFCGEIVRNRCLDVIRRHRKFPSTSVDVKFVSTSTELQSHMPMENQIDAQRCLHELSLLMNQADPEVIRYVLGHADRSDPRLRKKVSRFLTQKARVIRDRWNGET